MSLKAKIASENQTKVCPRCNRDLPLNSYNKGNVCMEEGVYVEIVNI